MENLYINFQITIRKNIFFFNLWFMIRIFVLLVNNVDVKFWKSCSIYDLNVWRYSHWIIIPRADTQPYIILLNFSRRDRRYSPELWPCRMHDTLEVMLTSSFILSSLFNHLTASTRIFFPSCQFRTLRSANGGASKHLSHYNDLMCLERNSGINWQKERRNFLYIFVMRRSEGKNARGLDFLKKMEKIYTTVSLNGSYFK